MKSTIIVIFGLLALCHASIAVTHPIVRESNLFETVIGYAINYARDIVAIFDPVHIEHHKGTIHGHTMELKNARLEGFSNFRTTKLEASGSTVISVAVDFELDRVTGAVEHWSVQGDKFYGDGDHNLEVNNVKLSIALEVDILKFKITKLHLKRSGTGKVSITGLYNDEKYSLEVTKKANEFLQGILNFEINGVDELLMKIMEILEQVINAIFTKKSA